MPHRPKPVCFVYTYALVLCLLWLLATVGHNLVSHGMMVDGTFYANIARNYAEGLGSAWRMQVGPGEVFFDAPPGYFWLVGGVFAALGDHAWVEKLWSFLCVYLQLPLCMLIYQRLFPDTRRAYLAAGTLLCCPLFYELINWNMLEGPMVLWLLLSVVALTYAQPNQGNTLPVLRHGWVRMAVMYALSGLLACMAVLTKGILALFIGLAPLITGLIPQGPRWKNLEQLSPKRLRFYRLRLFACTILAFGLPFVLLALAIWQTPAALNFWQLYAQNQILASLQAQREIDNPYFEILLRFLLDVLPMLIVFVLAWWRLQKNAQKPMKLWGLLWPLHPSQVFCLLLALGAVLPLTLSPKNRYWFLAMALPFFALVVARYFDVLLSRWKELSTDRLAGRGTLSPVRSRRTLGLGKVRRWWLALPLLLIGVATARMHAHSGQAKFYPRFHTDFTIDEWRKPADAVSLEGGWGEVFGCPERLATSWSVRADFARHQKLLIKPWSSLPSSNSSGSRAGVQFWLLMEASSSENGLGEKLQSPCGLPARCEKNHPAIPQHLAIYRCTMFDADE